MCGGGLKNGNSERNKCVTYKSITSGFSRLAIGDDNRLLDVPKHLEVFPQARIGRVVRKTPDKDLGICGVFLRRVHGLAGSGGVNVGLNKATAGGVRLKWRNASG